MQRSSAPAARRVGRDVGPSARRSNRWRIPARRCPQLAHQHHVEFAVQAIGHQPARSRVRRAGWRGISPDVALPPRQQNREQLVARIDVRRSEKNMAGLGCATSLRSAARRFDPAQTGPRSPDERRPSRCIALHLASRPGPWAMLASIRRGDHHGDANEAGVGSFRGGRRARDVRLQRRFGGGPPAGGMLTGSIADKRTGQRGGPGDGRQRPSARSGHPGKPAGRPVLGLAQPRELATASCSRRCAAYAPGGTRCRDFRLEVTVGAQFDGIGASACLQADGDSAQLPMRRG